MSPNFFSGVPTVLLHAQAPKTAAAQNVVTIGFGLATGVTGILVPLFMGDEPAKRFVSSLGEQGKGMTIFGLKGLDALESLLADLKKNGATHANFNAERDNPNPIPIDEVIDSLRNRPK